MSKRNYNLTQATEMVFSGGNESSESDSSLDADPLDEEQLSDDQDLTYVPSDESDEEITPPDRPGPSCQTEKLKESRAQKQKPNDNTNIVNINIIRDLEIFLKKKPINHIITNEDLKEATGDIKTKHGVSLTQNKTKSLMEVAKRNWTLKDKNPPAERFDQPLGPRPEFFKDCISPGDVFMKYMDSELIQHLCYQSNLYVNQKQRRITPFTIEEMYGFLGINLMMGYNSLPSWRDYWRSDPDMNVAYISSVMTRNRFGEMLSNLHTNDNHAEPAENTDKLYKLRPVINKLNQNFVQGYHISRRLSIDESMVRFKGRHSIKQYNPMKPIKRGYKLWMLSDTDGYIFGFDVYQGKSDLSSTYNEFGLGEKIVLDLTTRLANRYHEVYFDNYFTSIPLLENLSTKNIRACGTIRSNRCGLPSAFAPDNYLRRGESQHWVSKAPEIVFFKWKDNKCVHLASNFHGTDETTVTRTQKDGSKLDVTCPVAVKDYNAYIDGVDKSDMLCSIHGHDRKSKKWWHRLLFGLIDRALVNAMIAFSKLKDTVISELEFRRSVSKYFIMQARKPKVGRPLSLSPPHTVHKRTRGPLSVTNDVRLQNKGVHWPVFRDKRGRCEMCSRKSSKESRLFSVCSTCNIYLCLNNSKNCFNEYHGVSDS